MDRKELHKLSETLSKEWGREVVLVSAEQRTGGFLSDAFLLTSQKGEKFFLKRVKKNGEAGFELPERYLFSHAVSHGMGRRATLSPVPLGVIVSRKDEMTVLPEIDEQTSLYHLQEFSPHESISYWSLLQERRAKKKMDEQDKKEIEEIVDLLSIIHATPLPSKNVKILKTLYNDSVHTLLAYPGFFFTFLADYTDTHHLLPRKKHAYYIGLILKIFYKCHDHYKRLRPLHGDFWGTNIYFKKDGGAIAVDFSRIPYGDAGIDLGFFVIQFLWFYHETKNEYFRELGESFIERYKQKTGDKRVREFLCLPFGLLALLYLNPRFHPDNDPKVEKRFFGAVIKSLKRQTLVWK